MIKVEKAKVNDVDAIVEFQLKMARETEKIELDPARTKEGVQAALEDKEKGVYFLAYENNKVVGSLLITFEWSDWRNGTIWWIQSVYILPEFRRRGIFRKMYQFVKEIVENNPDLKGIRLYVNTSNNNAQQVYKSLGMDGAHYRMFEWMKT